MKLFIFYAVTLLAGLWIQVVQNHFLGGSLFSLQFLVVATVYWGLAHGPMAGSVIGFLWGLLTDAASLGLLGERALLFTIVGFAAGFSRRQLDDTKPWTQGIFTFFLSVGVIVGEWLLDHFFAGAHRPVSIAIWLQPLWNACMAPLLFVALRAWDLVWDSVERGD